VCNWDGEAGYTIFHFYGRRFPNNEPYIILLKMGNPNPWEHMPPPVYLNNLVDSMLELMHGDSGNQYPDVGSIHWG
jgi:hypothetical protein